MRSTLLLAAGTKTHVTVHCTMYVCMRVTNKAYLLTCRPVLSLLICSLSLLISFSLSSFSACRCLWVFWFAWSSWVRRPTSSFTVFSRSLAALADSFTVWSSSLSSCARPFREERFYISILSKDPSGSLSISVQFNSLWQIEICNCLLFLLGIYKLIYHRSIDIVMTHIKAK